jgi:Protein of unknown function (DUF4231)
VWDWAKRFTGQHAFGRTVSKIEQLLEDQNRSLSLDYLESVQLDVDETLHLQQVWQQWVRLWLILGNSTIWAVALLSSIFRWTEISRWTFWLYIVAVASTLISPAIAYIQYKRIRKVRLYAKKLRLLARKKRYEQDQSAGPESQRLGPLLRQKRYREETLDVIGQFREEAKRSRRTHNRFQIVIIAGSIFASAITTASVSFAATRWIAVGITAAVGLAAGFTGYFKFHERSFNLQQTADAIEREYESVELRVGKYAGLDEEKAFSLFASVVEQLRDEQNKRQQQLDQPVEVRREEGSAPA